MKNFYAILLLLLIGNFGFGQGTETFQNLPNINPYNNGSWTGNDGSTWEVTNASSNETINGKAVLLNDDEANTYVQSGTIFGGISDFTITTQRKFSGANGSLNILINGAIVGTVPYGASTQTTTISGINIAGDFVIRVNNNIGGNSGGGADRVAVDDITWTAFAASGPDDPSTLSTTATSSTQIDLAYDDNAASDDVVIVYNTDNVFDTPSGTPTVAGLFNDDEIIFVGSGAGTFNHTGLTESTTYYYRAYSYDGTDYSLGLSANATTPCATPTDVTAFTAVAGNSEIDLTWTNGSCFDEILVIAKEASAVTVTPTGDGTTYTADAIFGSGTDLGTNEYAVYKGTGTAVTVTGLTNGNTYHFSVFARKDTSWSAAVIDNATPVLSWCTVTGATGFGTAITLVDLGDINNVTGAGSGYDDFTSQTTDLAQGSTQDLTVHLDTAGNYTVHAIAWIDWNQDGIFDIVTEQYDLGITTDNADGATTLSALSIAVPASATLGNTRLRVVCRFDEDPTGPCAGTDDGEIEDYTVNITPPSTDTEVQFISASNSVSEDVGTYDLEFSITNEDVLTDTTFDVVLTTGDAIDIDNYATQTVTFLAGTNTNQIVTLTVTDDAIVEGDETLTFTIQNVVGGTNASAGVIDTFDLTISNNDVSPPIVLPYNEDFSNCATVEWTPFDETGDDSWLCSNGEYSMNGFDGTDDMDWLISDFTIDFDAYTNVNINVSAQERFGNSLNEAGEFELRYSTDYTGGDPTLATWTALTFNPNNTSSNATLSSEFTSTVDASGISGVAYLAFFYDMTAGSGPEDWRITEITIEAVNDTDTEIYEQTPQIAGSTVIAANSTSTVTAIDALNFIIEDQGTADGLPTNVTTMRFVPGPNNTADWTDHIQGVTLLDGNLTNPISPTTAINITDTEITLTFDTILTIPDNDSLEYILGFYLNTTNIVDGSVIQIQIDGAASGFIADASGSDFADPFLFDDIVGNDFLIDVDATQLVYLQQPTDTNIGNAMTPSAQVAYADTNGNIDADYDGAGFDVALTTDGSFDATSTTTVETVNGIATFNNLVFDTAGTGIKLTATDPNLFILGTFDSDLFNIGVGPIALAFQSFGADGGDWNYTTDPAEFTNTQFSKYWDVIDENNTAYPNTFGTIPSDGNFFFGIQDLANSNNGGTANGEFGSITFETLNVDAYENIQITFDYEVDGFDNDDDMEYQLIEDGVALPRVQFVNGNSNLNDDDTISINVTDGVNEISLIVFVRQNGGGDFGSLDNFNVIGTARTVVEYTFNDIIGWTPANPSGVSNSIDNISVVSGNANSGGDLINANTIANDLTIASGAKLVVNLGTGIKLNGTFTNAGELTIRSSSTAYGSIIADNVVNTGNLIYRRYTNSFMASGGRDLVSAPFSGETFGNFAQFQQNELNLYANPADPSVRLFGPYDKSGIGEFINYDEDVPADAAVVLTPGVGYRAATDPSSTSSSVGFLIFRGDMTIGPINQTIIQSAVGTNSREWNLVGNPYPSYIKLSDFLAANNSQFPTDAAGVYGYDDSATNYAIWNLAYSQFNPDALIAPGQGFFVASANATGTIAFTPAMRSFGDSDDFIFGRNTNSETANDISFMKIDMSSATKSYDTDFYFTDNATSGLDVGYDASTFGGGVSGFSIYSHLVEENEGVPMAVQSIGQSNLDNVSIPIGIKSNAGEQITFSIRESTLPDYINVYLEDNVANTMTLLSEVDYIVSLTTNENGTGRFYIHFTNTTLSTPDNALKNLGIFSNSSEKTVVITGQLLDKTVANIYDIQGRLVKSTDLNISSRTQSIDVSRLEDGVYVVILSNDLQRKTQKVILN